MYILIFHTCMYEYMYICMQLCCAIYALYAIYTSTLSTLSMLTTLCVFALFRMCNVVERRQYLCMYAQTQDRMHTPDRCRRRAPGVNDHVIAAAPPQKRLMQRFGSFASAWHCASPAGWPPLFATWRLPKPISRHTHHVSAGAPCHPR